METVLTPMTMDDRESVMEIFNYYIENSFAAYPERKLPNEFFDALMGACKGYPSVAVRDESGTLMGFGMLRAYNPFPAFSKTAEITNFIRPGFTGQGIGKTILDDLCSKGREKGITTILANISSLNEGSIRFHLKHGFAECGRFMGIGQKQGKTFDVVYCQMTL
jgi:phosphinothricin acetyltransferase